MSEKYPAAWRAACLDLLKARREELHHSLGFKRMSWEPIRNDVMRPYDEKMLGRLGQPDRRLIRQNFDSWDKGKVLADEKFAFIDLYVRSLALSGKDARAMRLIRDWRFRQVSSLLSTMYMRQGGTKVLGDKLFGSLPETLTSGELDGAWFRGVALRAVSAVDDVVEMVAAYLPVPIASLERGHFNDVVFFEGYLLPLEISERITDDLNRIINTTCTLKLTRPEFRGLSGLGYAEAEFRIQRGDSGTSRFWMELPSPAVCPNIAQEWVDQNSKAVMIYQVERSKIGGGIKKISSTSSIEFKRNVRNIKVLNELFDFSYKGYL